MSRIFLLTVFCFLSLSTPAHAYLDPGTGSMILQALAAAAVGIAIFWRSLLRKVKELFGGAKSSDKKHE